MGRNQLRVDVRPRGTAGLSCILSTVSGCSTTPSETEGDGMGSFYLDGSGGHSTIQGHEFIVFTLFVLFLTIVIFIAPSPSSPPQGSSCLTGLATLSTRCLPQILDNHVHQPWPNRAAGGFSRVFRLFFPVHCSLQILRSLQR